MWCVTLGTITRCAKKVTSDPDEQRLPLMGVAGAFVFAAQMINFTIPATGSSGHVGGGLLLTLLLGPPAAFLAMAAVLSMQALFFADGGILALGCNIWNLAAYPCFVAYPFVYRPLAPSGARPWRVSAGALLGAIVALQLGAGSVVLETVLSGRSELPLRPFLLLMQPIHLAIGMVEGVITAATLRFLAMVDPGLLRRACLPSRLAVVGRPRRLIAWLLVFALLMGGVVSWFASVKPDGLEWVVQRVAGVAELPESADGIAAALKAVQVRMAILPKYTFPSNAEIPTNTEAWPRMDLGTSFSGVLGATVIIGVMSLAGMTIRIVRRRAKTHQDVPPAGPAAG
jgi:cobalt/nickel transport system permease protein